MIPQNHPWRTGAIIRYTGSVDCPEWISFDTCIQRRK